MLVPNYFLQISFNNCFSICRTVCSPERCSTCLNRGIVDTIPMHLITSLCSSDAKYYMILYNLNTFFKVVQVLSHYLLVILYSNTLLEAIVSGFYLNYWLHCMCSLTSCIAHSSLTSQTLFYCVGVGKESLVQSNTRISNYHNEIVT